MLKTTLPVLTLALLFLNACGSGGLGDSVTSSTVNPLTNNDSSGAGSSQLTDINGGLTGLVWLSEDGQYLDVETGEQISLTWNHVYPGRDGQEYIDNCKLLHHVSENLADSIGFHCRAGYAAVMT